MCVCEMLLVKQKEREREGGNFYGIYSHVCMCVGFTYFLFFIINIIVFMLQVISLYIDVE